MEDIAVKEEPVDDLCSPHVKEEPPENVCTTVVKKKMWPTVLQRVCYNSLPCKPEPGEDQSSETCSSEQLHAEDVIRRGVSDITEKTSAHYKKPQEEKVRSPGAATAVKEEMDIGPIELQRVDMYYNMLPYKPKLGEDQPSGSCPLEDLPLKDVVKRQTPESSPLTTCTRTNPSRWHGTKRISKVNKAAHCCSVCRKTFVNNQVLRRHMSIHTEQKPFVCDICSNSFSQTISLSRHMFIHTGFKPYCCGVCSKSFVVKSDLTKHVKCHTKEKFHTGEKCYNCHVCSKVFSNNVYLKRHISYHTGQKRYSCNECSRSFSLKVTLSRHMVVHADKKPYSCKVCSKSFTQEGSLKRHMFIHSIHKPHKCGECCKSFIRRSQLHQHMLNH